MSKRELDGEPRLDVKYPKLEPNGLLGGEAVKRSATPPQLPPQPPPPPPFSRSQAQITYKEGQPLRTLVKAYEARVSTDSHRMVEVIIPAEFVNKDNKRVKLRQLWGDLTYTWDSDVVAALMHQGCVAFNLAAAPSNVATFHALLRVTGPQEEYPEKLRFTQSRKWCGSSDKLEGCSFTVERCWLTTRAHAVVELPSCLDELPAPVPTLQPAPTERTVTTRTSGAKGRICQEVSVLYNLCNEPWQKYTLSAVADKGPTAERFTSQRLSGEVLLLETTGERFQITYNHASSNAVHKLFTFARCRHARTLVGLQRCGVPLPAAEVEVVEDDLDWEELQWGVTTLHVRQHSYVLKCLHFALFRKPL